MNRKKMRKFLWGIAIVLALLVAYFVMENRAGYQASDSDQMGYSSPAPTGKAANTTIGGLTIVNVTPNITYTTATQKYKGNIVQFDAMCHVSPSAAIVVKNGTTMMFDNRSAGTRAISLNGYKMSLKAYGWIALTLKSGKLPLKISIDCDKGQQNGTITLEK